MFTADLHVETHQVLVFVLGFVLFYSFWKVLFKKDVKETSFLKGSKNDVLVLELEKLYRTWKEQEKTEIYLEQLARIWRTYDEEVEVTLETVDFKHDLLLEFYVRYLKGRTWFKGRVKEVVLGIMKLLDEKGDVPSVVKIKNEVYDLDENTYTLLSRVSLLEHSVHVAEEAMNLGVSGVYEAPLLIAALSHDLGKIPEYLPKFYTLGDHPLISVVVLEEIPGFKDLPFAEEVKQAVASHHRAGKGKLVELLKQADKNARKREISELLQKKENSPSSVKVDLNAVEANFNEKKESRKKEKPKEEKREEEKLEEVREAEESSEIVYDYDLSWLNVSEFMQELKKEVNQVVQGRWVAFSMPNGVVYVHPTGMWRILKRLALKERVHDVVVFEGDEVFKRSVLVSLVKILRKEGYVADWLIQEGYFAAPFLVYREDEKTPTRVLYLPLKVEAFGVLPSEFESLKGETLKKVVKVEPAYTQ